MTRRSDVIYHLFQSEMEMCSAVICHLAQLKEVTFVMTFNGSSDLYHDGLGYDIPFIVKRSQMDLHLTKKVLGMT
jgi:hypothetical protein